MKRRRQSFLGRLFGLPPKADPDPYFEARLSTLSPRSALQLRYEREVVPKKKKGKRGKLASCEPFTVQVWSGTTPRGFEVIDAKAMRWNRSSNVLGFLSATMNVRARTLDVDYADVKEPGCGMGTRLYEAIAREACDRGLRMRSDRMLTNYSEGFWRKQVEKGRARWDQSSRRFVLNACESNLEAAGRRKR
jgi:hypothetical protein